MIPSSDSGPTAVPLLEETIPQNLARTVAEHGDRDALVSVEQGLRYSYSEFAAEVDRVARGLMATGVAQGDRVGIWSPNYAEWVLVQYATARIGAILVTINPAYRSSELEYVLNQSGTSVLVAVDSLMTSDYRSPHGRGHRHRRLDAHRRPRGHGRRGLREHRRAHHGHDHPRRRERLPPRDRGVPLHPPRHRRRASDRRARRSLRRGGHGLDPTARRRQDHGGGHQGLLPGHRRPTTRSPATSSSPTPSP